MKTHSLHTTKHVLKLFAQTKKVDVVTKTRCLTLSQQVEAIIIIMLSWLGDSCQKNV